MPDKVIVSDSTRKLLSWIAIATAAILVVGLVFAPERAWSNLLIATFYLLTIGLGGTVFIALTYVSGAGWHVAFRRVPEALAMIVPMTGVAVLFVLGLRINQYGWHHHGEGGAGTFWFKELWLTPSFWLLRSVGYVAIWSVLGSWLVFRSRKQDASSGSTGSKMLTGNIRLSAFFLAVYAVTFSLASADWIMALEPMWFSTMWGVYNFAGMILAALAVIVIFCVLLSEPGRALHGIFSTEHLHDLGKLLIGFSCFWMYIWFSQYMLIWYANIPEETSYFVTRTHGPWGPVVVVSIIVNWLIPFFVLLPKLAKRNRGVMMKIACLLLLGRWIDLYLMVFPATMESTPIFGILEVAGLCFIAVAGFALLAQSFGNANAVARTDPYLEESLHYHA